MREVLQTVVDEIEIDIQAAAREVFRCYATKVREDTPRGEGGLPFDTGLLKAGLQLTSQTYRNGVSSAVFQSTARSRDGFDYPTHLDLGGRHVGWWRKVNKEKILADCVDEIFPRFNL